MKKILCVGQAPPQTDPTMPFGRTKLYKWFESIGINKFILNNPRSLWNSEFIASFNDNKIGVSFDAVYNKFPGSKNGSHLQPSEEQVAKYMPMLKSYILKYNPDIIIPIGVLSIKYCLNDFNITLENTIGKKFILNPYKINMSCTVIPLPHPSGVSSWIYMHENMALLNKSLELIKNYFDE